MILVTRNVWGARAPKAPPTPLASAKGVGLHWEGGELGDYAHDSCNAKLHTIQNFHMDSRGWNDIAYSAVVCRHGVIYEARGVGVRTAANGTNDSNAHYYAVCGLMGQEDTITSAMRNGLIDAVNWLRNHGAGFEVYPHSHFFPTACPGPDITALAGELNGKGSPSTPEEAMAQGAYVAAKLPRNSNGSVLLLKSTAAGRIAFYAVMANGDIFNWNVPTGFSFKSLSESGIKPNSPITDFEVGYGLDGDNSHYRMALLSAGDGGTFLLSPS